MAMDAETLSASILTKWKADPNCGFSSPLSNAQATLLKAQADAIAAAVVEHIQSSASVTVTSVAGVTPGSGVSGAGSGTIS